MQSSIFFYAQKNKWMDHYLYCRIFLEMPLQTNIFRNLNYYIQPDCSSGRKNTYISAMGCQELPDIAMHYGLCLFIQKNCQSGSKTLQTAEMLVNLISSTGKYLKTNPKFSSKP